MTTSGFSILRRREFLGVGAGAVLQGADPVLRPAVSQAVCPLERTTPRAQDGHSGLAFLRKPPGKGPFPSVIIIHGGLVTRPEADLKQYALDSPLPCRLLADGYAVATVTYRSRNVDPQDKRCLQDCLAAVNHLKRLPYVDPKSLVLTGCSGGGDLTLEVAAVAEVCAIAPEEPASMLLTGVYNSSTPKKGAIFTPADSADIEANPKRYYTDQAQKLTRAKLARIQCPILIIQSDVHHVNWFNRDVLIPELRALGKKLEVLTYPGEPHCFCFYGEGQRTPHPEVALKAFADMASFFRRHAPTKPKALDSTIVTLVPVRAA